MSSLRCIFVGCKNLMCNCSILDCYVVHPLAKLWERLTINSGSCDITGVPFWALNAMFLQSYSESCVCDKLRLLCSCCLKYAMARCRARHMAASIWMLALWVRTKQGLGTRCVGGGVMGRGLELQPWRNRSILLLPILSRSSDGWVCPECLDWFPLWYCGAK